MSRLIAMISRHKWPLTILLGVAGGIAASQHFVAQAQAERIDAQRQLSWARNQLATAEEDQKNMKNYTAEFGELLKHNIIGNNHRMDWIENLEQIRQQNLVLSFKYTISPQHVYTLPASQESGNFELNVSGISMQFELLHEAQLMDFFDAVRTASSGWLSIDHCTMERIVAPINTAQLKAACTGGWFTLANRNGT